MKISQLLSILNDHDKRLPSQPNHNRRLYYNLLHLINEDLVPPTSPRDRDLITEEKIRLALLIEQTKSPIKFGYPDFVMIQEIRDILGHRFVDLIQYLAHRGVLNLFDSRIFNDALRVNALWESMRKLLNKRLDQPNVIRYCFARINHCLEAAEAVVTLAAYNPRLITPENLDLLMGFIEPAPAIHPYRFYEVCHQLLSLSDSVPRKGRTERGFALFLQENNGPAHLPTLTKILSKADPRLPSFQPAMPFIQDRTDPLRNIFPDCIGYFAKKPILAAQVIASFSFLRVPYPEYFKKYTARAIQESDSYTPELSKIMTRYFKMISRGSALAVPLGSALDTPPGTGFLFLNQLFDLKKSEIHTELALSIHKVNPLLLKPNMQNIFTHAKQGRHLITAIQALHNIKTISQEDLTLLFKNPSDAIITGMSLGAIFSRTHPLIQHILTDLGSFSALYDATAKYIPAVIFENIASSLGLSPGLQLLVMAHTVEERQANQAFFMGHLDAPLPRQPRVVTVTAMSRIGSLEETETEALPEAAMPSP